MPSRACTSFDFVRARTLVGERMAALRGRFVQRVQQHRDFGNLPRRGDDSAQRAPERSPARAGRETSLIQRNRPLVTSASRRCNSKWGTAYRQRTARTDDRTGWRTELLCNRRSQEGGRQSVCPHACQLRPMFARIRAYFYHADIRPASCPHCQQPPSGKIDPVGITGRSCRGKSVASIEMPKGIMRLVPDVALGAEMWATPCRAFFGPQQHALRSGS